MKTVKFALGNLIPLIGGALSDAVGTVAGSLNLIKTTCGAVCAAAVVILILPLILQLLLHRAVLAVCQGAADLVGCEKESRLIGEVHSVLGYMLAVVSLASVLFLFVLALMCSTKLTG